MGATADTKARLVEVLPTELQSPACLIGIHTSQLLCIGKCLYANLNLYCFRDMAR